MAKVKADHTICIEPLSCDPVDALMILMKPVIAQLINDKEHNKNAAGQPGHKAGDVDQTVALVFSEITKSDFQVVLEHACPLLLPGKYDSLKRKS